MALSAWPRMQRLELRIPNRLGLHARPAAKLVQLANRFASTIQIIYKNKKANAKSILGVLMLAAGHGAKIIFEIEGPDEMEAAKAIEQLTQEGFGEA